MVTMQSPALPALCRRTMLGLQHTEIPIRAAVPFVAGFSSARCSCLYLPLGNAVALDRGGLTSIFRLHRSAQLTQLYNFPYYNLVHLPDLPFHIDADAHFWRELTRKAFSKMF